MAKSSSKYHNGLYRPHIAAWKILLVAVLVMGVAVAVVLTLPGSRFHWSRVFGPPSERPVDPRLLALRQSALEAEKSYRARSLSNPPTDEELSPLGQAVSAWREYLASPGASDPQAPQRFDSLEREFDGLRGQSALARSRALEDEARRQEDAGNMAEAARLLREAVRLQRQVNTSRASALRNTSRESLLTREVRNLEVRPLAEQARVAEQRAVVAEKAGRAQEALAAWSEALAAQRRVQQDFPETTAADPQRLMRYERAVASLRSAADAAAVDELETRAAGQTAAGRHDEATKLLAEAVERQRKLMREYPMSRYAEAARLERLATAQESSAGAGEAEKLRTAEEALSSMLASRRSAEALAMAAQLGRDLSGYRERFPRSNRVPAGLPERLSLLSRISNGLGALQAQVDAALVPLPGQQGRSLLRTELPQGLYRTLMGTNPSRHSGDVFPVESVSWGEAAEFARRLGWILGQPVSLPREEDYRAAWGASAPAYDPAAIWSAENSGGATHEVGSASASASGYKDLFGNVAEWLDTSAGAEMAIAFGGSFLDRPGVFRVWPLAQRAKDDRSRSVGFRVVVVHGGTAAAASPVVQAPAPEGPTKP